MCDFVLKRHWALQVEGPEGSLSQFPKSREIK